MSNEFPGRDTFPSAGRRPNMIDALIAEIVTRLAEKLPPVLLVKRFPNNPEQFDFQGFEAAALVHYGGSDYASGAPSSSLNRQVRIDIILLVRALHGDDTHTIGLTDILDDVRLALQGETFAGARALMPQRDEFEEANSEVIRWRFSFTTILPAMNGMRRPSGILSIPRQEPGNG